jgi:hypothetical protein
MLLSLVRFNIADGNGMMNSGADDFADLPVHEEEEVKLTTVSHRRPGKGVAQQRAL